MIDWFWSNMEKGFVLWHPSEHEPLSWAVPVRPGTLVGAVHLAPQTWSDGTFRNLYIRFEDPATLATEIQERIVYEHCVVAAGLGFGAESLEVEEPMGYRVHQWQKTDVGVVGRSSAIGGERPESPEEGLVWAKHCAEEIGNWGAFLPQLYALYRVVERPAQSLRRPHRRAARRPRPVRAHPVGRVLVSAADARGAGHVTNPLHGWRVDRDSITFVGHDLQRPECILAEPDGTLWTADARGGRRAHRAERDAGARRPGGRRALRGVRRPRSATRWEGRFRTGSRSRRTETSSSRTSAPTRSSG